jgi:hypothetical protein
MIFLDKISVVYVTNYINDKYIIFKFNSVNQNKIE